MEFTANNTMKCAKRIEGAADQLRKGFKGEWQDAVKDSFNSFVVLSQRISNEVAQNAQIIEGVCNDLNDLKIDVLLEESVQLYHECESTIDSVSSAILDASSLLG